MPGLEEQAIGLKYVDEADAVDVHRDARAGPRDLPIPGIVITGVTAWLMHRG